MWVVALLGLSKHYYFVLCSFATSGRLANMQHGTSCGSNFGEQLTAQCWGTTSHLRIKGYFVEVAIMGTHNMFGLFGLFKKEAAEGHPLTRTEKQWCYHANS